jgi:hypothetical protein
MLVPLQRKKIITLKLQTGYIKFPKSFLKPDLRVNSLFIRMTKKISWASYNNELLVVYK